MRMEKKIISEDVRLCDSAYQKSEKEGNNNSRFEDEMKKEPRAKSILGIFCDRDLITKNCLPVTLKNKRTEK